MSPRREFTLKAIGVAAACFLAAAVFSAYLRPGMLIEFANLVLCM
ncbi:MAG TPA: hypothetical protein VML57_10345 [Burkholderiales bacterium]|jgi:hypothetical protein|nr:hypothetical protein [Burkholderiales bacterium]